MIVETIAVGTPQEVSWNGKLVRTSIFKRSVDGSVRVGKLNIGARARQLR